MKDDPFECLMATSSIRIRPPPPWPIYAIGTAIHPQVSVIITEHVALELEVDQVLRRFLSRHDKLPRLSMEHRLSLLRAMLNSQ